MIEEKCPVCGKSKCKNLIVDVLSCPFCGHIFKMKDKDEYEKPILATELHMYKNPFTDLRDILKNRENKEFEFEFPSMMLHEIELSPTSFYRSQFRQYFNQMSLLILFQRCGLQIEEQHNTWSGGLCITKLKTKRREI